MIYELNASAKGITKVFGDSVEVAPGILVPKVALTDYLGGLLGIDNPLPVKQTRLRSFSIHYEIENASTSTDYLLIDLSETIAYRIED